MAIVKPKLDFSNDKTTLWKNIVSFLLSASDSAMDSIYPFYYINGLETRLGRNSDRMAKDILYFHPDYNILVTQLNVHTSGIDCEASGRVLAGNSTIDTLIADEEKQCLMPKSGSTIPSFQFYLSIIGQIESVLEGEKPDLARKDYPISNITGLSFADWIIAGSQIETGIYPYDNYHYSITPQLIDGIIDGNYRAYSDINLINTHNKNYLEYGLSKTNQAYYNDQIPDKFPLPLDCLGGKPNKTKGQILNEYAKLYQKAYQLVGTECFEKNTTYALRNILMEPFGCYYKRNDTSYYTSESWSDDDEAWVVNTEISQLNGESIDDGSLWDTTEYEELERVSSSLVDGYLQGGRDYHYSFTTYAVDDSNGYRWASHSNTIEYPTELYIKPYVGSFYNPNMFSYGNINNKDAEIYCETKMMIVYWHKISQDSKTGLVLNDAGDGTEVKQKRQKTEVNYETVEGTQTKTYLGEEDKLEATLLHEQSYTLNLSNLVKNHSTLYKEQPTGTLAEGIAVLGVFDGVSNPYGLIKVSGVGAKILQILKNPDDMPDVKYEQPTTVTWENNYEHERGEDRWDYSAGGSFFNGSIEIRTVNKWFQKINNQMIQIFDQQLLDIPNFSFDFNE